MDFERLASRHKDAVYRQLFRMCGNHEDAEDVLVESLARAYRFQDQLQDERAFQGWLAQIGRRTCGRLKKRESLRPFFSMALLEEEGFQPVSDVATPEEVAMEGEMRDCIHRALDGLPDLYREAYQLRDIEELTAEEASRRLGITIAALKSRLHRARAMVRERIDCELEVG
ncbi:MAG: sigma-70 family RNA polymerase sigma factor [Fimbriimonadaceae bacterium]|nr:sigma-70 family RNA polymerase sigma factor [Fimbriimonadaceae bacterium]